MRLLRPRPIGASDSFMAFDCGDARLNGWIQQRALRNEAAGGSRTFVSVDDDTGLVAGYYCLAAGALKSEDATAAIRRNMPDPIPIVLIGRLAVDVSYQGKGVGTSLLQDASLKSLEVSNIVAARAILVHAASAEAQRFYEKYGFRLMPGSERTLALLMADARETVRHLG